MCRSHPRAWSPRALDIAAAQLSLRIGLRGESGRVAWAAFFDGIPVSTAVWVESAGSAMCAAAELPGPCCPRACPRRARPTLVHARAGPVGVLCVAAHLINSFFMCAPRDRVRAARLRTAVPRPVRAGAQRTGRPHRARFAPVAHDDASRTALPGTSKVEFTCTRIYVAPSRRAPPRPRVRFARPPRAACVAVASTPRRRACPAFFKIRPTRATRRLR